jgi:hypothetical protein
MASRITQRADSQLAWAARKLAGAALAPDDELLGFEEGHLRRLADGGADKPVVTQPSWARAVPFARGLTIVTYTRTRLLFLAVGLGVNCPLVAVHRAELDAGNRQTFAFRRQGSPLSVLGLDPVRGEKPRQFLDCLLAVRDQERQKLSPDDRMTWEKRDEALQQHDLDRLWKVATAPWPQTCVGRWLRAGFLDQRELRDRLKQTLNGGDPKGWNYEEPFVVAAVCEIAVRKLFQTAPDAQAVTAFVTGMRGRIRSTAPPGQQVCEAVIRDAFRDPDVDFTNVSSAELFRAHGAVAGMAVRTLGLDEAAIDEMIAEGERLTFDLGRHPPLAPAGI